MLADKYGQKKWNSDEVIEEIIYLVQHERDMAEFGINVAGVLFEFGCIDEAVYHTLLG
ncbi:hypothetical protein [Acidilutibacter cellobiosedens]|jgi:hypothetical protein|uniref:hypothetical protein n=1 Tax=Acidilutibacter cellobiosedens TaxID=2507161 RepID=UPI001476F2E5|nr:hypothetical protein [Acidilutibacter cellobiosedens]